MSTLFCLFLCFRSYPEVYIPIFYKIRYILEELCVAVIQVISQLIIYIDQLNTAYILGSVNILVFTLKCQVFQWWHFFHNFYNKA